VLRKIHSPVVAGQFYPADPVELREQVQSFIASARPVQAHTPKALIAPHAGYIYSGPVAGTAYAQLREISDRIRRVVILAPSHRLGFSGIACNSAEWFRTPLGDLEVDQEAMAMIQNMPQVHLLDQAFAMEHSLEVHLPFLQEMLSDFKIVPLLVGDVEAAEVATVIERLWGGNETLIVISSDLSHYLDYDSARRIDAETSSAIEALQPEALSPHDACGCTPLTGLLLVAKRRNLHATTLDQRNSGDTAGSKNRVVGYGAYAVY